MTETTAREPRLLPDERLPIRYEKVHLSQLPDDASLESPAPTSEFIGWIRAVGQLSAITVGEKDGQLHVHNGRRRIKAMRMLAREWEARRNSEEGVVEDENPWEYVDAGIVDDNHYLAHEALTLMLQQQKPNPIAEIETIERLIRKDYSPTQIAKQLHMPKATIEKKMKLMDLAPELKRALYDGNLAIGSAERAAGLPERAQQRLVALLEEKGKITGKDIEDQTRARTQAAASSTSLSGLSGLPTVDSIPDTQDDPPRPSQGLSEPDQDILEAASYLSERVDAVLKVDHGKRPKWSKKDAELVALLLSRLS